MLGSVYLPYAAKGHSHHRSWMLVSQSPAGITWASAGVGAMLLLLLLSRFSRVRLCATPETAAHQALRPWDSPGKNAGVGCHFLLQCVKVKSERAIAGRIFYLCVCCLNSDYSGLASVPLSSPQLPQALAWKNHPHNDERRRKQTHQLNQRNTVCRPSANSSQHRQQETFAQLSLAQ